jgi:hypothetical protein
MRLFYVRLIAAVLAAAYAAPAFAADSASLYRIEGFTTQDQHEKPYIFSPSVQTVLAACTMGAGQRRGSFLRKTAGQFRPSRSAILSANIYGMPGVGRKCALSKMCRYPHRILLADGEQFLARYPRAEKKLTVRRLDADSVITAINFVDPEKGLPSAFASTFAK